MTRRCWCGRSIPPDSISTCGCCCTEHDDAPAQLAAAMDRHPAGKRIPEHLRIDDINDYLRQKGELS